MDAFFAGNRHIGNIPEEFKESPEIVKAIELAQESAYISTELAAYDEYLDAVRVVETVREDALKVK